MVLKEKNNIFLLLTALLGPIGLFFLSGSGGVVLSVFALVLGQAFYDEIGYLPITFYIITIILSLIWAVSAIKNKKKGNDMYFPYITYFYKEGDKEYKYFLNVLLGMVQFGGLILLIFLAYKITINIS